MTKAEIEARLKKVEYAEFILQMKDTWSRSDYDEDDRLRREIRELKKQLAEMED